MNTISSAGRTLRDGDPVAALKQLQEEVRAKPADAKLRTFLFQLLAVLGQWERADNQLDVAVGLDPSTLAMKQTYHEAILCELLRRQVFEGKTSPLVLGQPEPWLGVLIESLLQSGRGAQAAAATLRADAFEQAPATPGLIDGRPFQWIADADSRLGPVLEAIINGRYYWVPFTRLKRIVIEPPADLRDYVWMPAHLDLENDGVTVALIPTRYPGSEADADPQIVLARSTRWIEAGPDEFHGRGQRLLATDAGEHALMDVREIKFGTAADVAAGGEA
jgi:type VI secretion system protein ImpE